MGLHDLRHSAAGLAFESLALNEVSRLLRHANPRVTTTVYGGISDDAAASDRQQAHQRRLRSLKLDPALDPGPRND